jgi:biotin-dependent carboxylase-like uncharacterized protein
MSVAALEVVSVAGPATLQDAGRPGHMADGVPPGGALVPDDLAHANRAVGNHRGACAIEVFGRLTVRALRAVEVATEEGVIALGAGESLEVRPGERSRARYLAIRGGLDAPEVLGGRGTLVIAALGGHQGRALRRGDRLDQGDAVEQPRVRPTPDHDESPIRVVLGPDRASFGAGAIQTMLGATFAISPVSDRTGVRLDGPTLERIHEDDAASRPMVCGAIEVPRGGAPIVLGPDHPTTGGYPLIAVVARADHGRLFGRRPGVAVRFRSVTVDEARAAWRDWLARLGD